MRFSSAVVLASLVAVSTASAQGGGAAANAACTGVSADACQQAVDYFAYMAPQLGTAVTGGNTTLGQGGNLGTRFGFMPKIAIGVRINGVLGNAPKFAPTAQLPGTTTPPQSQRATATAAIPMPTIDVAAGVFKGIPLGVTTVGGVDLIASVAYLPEYNGTEFSVKPKSSTAIGFGARVGLLQEGLTSPGVGFSFVTRKLPVTTLSSTQSGSSFAVDELDVKSTAWRLTVSKSLLILGVAAGVGKDKYTNSIKDIQATMSGGPTITTPTLKSEVTRTNYFVDLSMNLFLAKLVATVGQVSGGDIKTYNSYDNSADKSRLYASGGVRIGF